jgi:hypothetical protein
MLHTFGVAYEALQRLAALYPLGWPMLVLHLQRIVNEPLFRRQIAAALASEDPARVTMTREDWIERETYCLQKLAAAGLMMPSDEQIAAAWFVGCGPDHRFVPHCESMRSLIDLGCRLGLRLPEEYRKFANDSDSEHLLTEAGVLEQNLLTLMQKTDKQGRPFNCGMDKQQIWSSEQRGESVTSVEETLYLAIRCWIELERLPFMSCQIRCRNRNLNDNKSSLMVDFIGQQVVTSYPLTHVMHCVGAIARRFTPLPQ